MDAMIELSIIVESYRKNLELMRKSLEAKDKENRMIAGNLSSAVLPNKEGC